MLPPSPLTDPDVQISRIRFLAGELRSGGVAVDDHGPGKGMAGEECVEACPCEPFRARSSLQPLPPYLCDLLTIPVHVPNVPRDAVVGIVTFELRRQPGVLPGQQLMAVCPTPVIDCPQRTGKAVLLRRLPHHVLALLRFHPGVGKAEKVERLFLAVRMRAAATLRAELDEERLGGMEREPLPFKPLPEHLQHAFGVVVDL